MLVRFKVLWYYISKYIVTAQLKLKSSWSDYIMTWEPTLSYKMCESLFQNAIVVILVLGQYAEVLCSQFTGMIFASLIESVCTDLLC